MLTAVDILNLDNKKIIPNSNSVSLDDIEITNRDRSFNEKMLFINNFLNDNSISEDKLNLKKYLSKFEGRYDAKVSVEGNKANNYRKITVAKVTSNATLNVNFLKRPLCDQGS